MTFTKILRWLGRGVYTGFVPINPSCTQGAEEYLVDLWRSAPKRVAFVHTALALTVTLLPFLFLRRLKLFPSLLPKEQERMILKMMRSPIYLFRLIAYGVKGHALVAVLRHPQARRMILSTHYEMAEGRQSA